jgi:hypothetical protein
MGEDVKDATEGIEFERLFNEDAQAVYRLAKVYGLPTPAWGAMTFRGASPYQGAVRRQGARSGAPANDN